MTPVTEVQATGVGAVPSCPEAHALPAADVYAALATNADGLSEEDAQRRLVLAGPNRLTPPKAASAIAILADQLRSVVAALLVVAAFLSLVFGDSAEAAAIAAVLVINTTLGFVLELRARRAMEGLLSLDVAKAWVVRSGTVHAIDAQALVPGDLIELAAGQTVPADGRLVLTHDFRTDESALTGESLPVTKRGDAPLARDTLLADRRNMVYKGTTVMAGSARAAIVATGRWTEVGRIGTLVAAVEEEQTPLERRLDALGHRLVWLALGVGACIAALGIVHGAPAGAMIETGIALAVAAVPEGLPAVATIALAIGLRRMARRRALVRRLPAVEALGSTTVVCTDKTRTLTSGDMSVVCLRTMDAVCPRRRRPIGRRCRRRRPTARGGHHREPSAGRRHGTGFDRGGGRSRGCGDPARRQGVGPRTRRTDPGTADSRDRAVLERAQAHGPPSTGTVPVPSPSSRARRARSWNGARRCSRTRRPASRAGRP